MRTTAVVLLSLLLMIGCESPQDLSQDQTLYQGRVVQNDRAPFLIAENSLAKATDGLVIIDASVVEGTVYGLEADTTVYAATGGEILPTETWIDNVSDDIVQVDLTSKSLIVFEDFTTVTVIDAIDMIYVNAEGEEVLFSGTGVITAIEISTKPGGSVTVLASTKFSIGGDGGDWG